MRNKEKRLIHWSPDGTYSRSLSLDEEVGNGTIYCQAVVQILFADSNQEWTAGQIGELVLYKTKPKRSIDSSDLFLSFFASERVRFLIKLSEGIKFWRTNKNFVAILHGRLIGLNFAIEHSHQAEQLIKYMQSFYYQKQQEAREPFFTERFIRALKHWRQPKQQNKIQLKPEPFVMNQPQYTMISSSSNNCAIQKSNNFVSKKKQIKIENNNLDDLDPILQPREFIKQMSDCAASEDI